MIWHNLFSQGFEIFSDRQGRRCTLTGGRGSLFGGAGAHIAGCEDARLLLRRGHDPESTPSSFEPDRLDDLLEACVLLDRRTHEAIRAAHLEEHRGRGLGKWMVETACAHPALTGARRIMLGTRDAHELYRRHGFVEPPNDGILMQILRPDIYRRGASAAVSADPPDAHRQ